MRIPSPKVSVFMILMVVPYVGGCHREIILDHGEVCASIEGEPEGYVLEVTANSLDCSGQDRNSDFECEISVDGDIVTATTTLYKGHDRDSGCSFQINYCSVAIEHGEYTLRYGDQEALLTVPNMETVCLATVEGP